MTRPDSPCIAICDTLYREVCTGCGRHYLEVSNWATMTPEQKELVWVRIETERTSKRYTTYKERVK